MIHPAPVTLQGYGVRLEPLERAHSADLVRAASDGDVWRLWFVSVADLEPGREHIYIDAALAGRSDGHMLPWAVRELTTGEIVGSTRFHDIVPSIDRVEVGYTFYASHWQRTHVNAACKRLVLGHAFDALGCKVVGFQVDGLNARSQRALEAIGAKRDGVLRHYRERDDGSARDLFVYSILASEWAEVRERLDQRLQILIQPRT